MFTIMNKSLILNEIKLHYGISSDAKFAEFLGIKPQVLSNWRARNTFDYELIYTKCVEIDGNWLLSGEGDKLRKSEKNKISENLVDVLEERKYTIELQKKYIATLESKLKKDFPYLEVEASRKHVAEDPEKLK